MNGPSILIIEDEKDLCQILRDLLNFDGFDVDTANDGEEGINLIKKHSYAVVVLDLKMPKVSGPAVLKFIKGGYPDTKVIITTGVITGELPAQNEPLEKGEYLQSTLNIADAVMLKPYDYAELAGKIRELIIPQNRS